MQTVLVDARRTAHEIKSLGVRCDRQEIPEFVSGEKPKGWWLAGICSFEGRAVRSDGMGEAVEPVTEAGTAALAVGGDHLIGIIAPDTPTEPALWFAWDLRSVEVRTAGSQGLLRKRPTDITLAVQDGVVKMTQVSRLYRHSGSYQAGQEASFLKALAA